MSPRLTSSTSTSPFPISVVTLVGRAPPVRYAFTLEYSEGLSFAYEFLFPEMREARRRCWIASERSATTQHHPLLHSAHMRPARQLTAAPAVVLTRANADT